MSNDLFASFLSIMLDNINEAGKCVDEDICKDIAGFISMLPYETAYGEALYEFIYEYGEDSDDRYMGRDENGEKQYYTTNKNTNWHERIRRELCLMGYYKRYNEYWAAKRAA
jgi:hypothetical protein